MTSSPLTRLCSVLLLIAATAQLPAQQVDCVVPARCALSDRADRQHIAVRLTTNGTAVKNAAVTLVATSGKIVDLVRTNDDGVAEAVWTGDTGNGLVEITATAVIGATVVSRKIALGYPARLDAEARKSEWYDRFWSPHPQWYQSRQLKKSYSVQIAVNDPTQCPRIAVVFRPYGEKAIATPDTAWGETRTVGGESRCFAAARWNLAGVVGQQTMRVTLVNDLRQHADVKAVSRGLPWVGMGIAFTGVSDYVSLARQRGTIKVTRRFQTSPTGDTLEVTYDSVRASVAIDSLRRQTMVSPVIGVDFPVILRLHWLRLFTAADLANPTRNWFVGLSVPQVFSGYQHEDVGFDVHLVGQISRREVLTDPAACAVTTTACKTQSRTGLVGGGVLLAVNTSTVLEKLLTALLPK